MSSESLLPVSNGDGPTQACRNLLALIRLDQRTLAFLSSQLRKNASYIHQFLHRGTPRNLNEFDRYKLASVFNVDPSVFGGHLGGATFSSETKLCEIKELRSSEKPDYKIICYDMALLDGLQVTSTEDLAFFKINDETMSPTLRAGATILIDVNTSKPIIDGIYALALGEETLIKRIGVNPGTQKLKVSSDNMLYES